MTNAAKMVAPVLLGSVRRDRQEVRAAMQLRMVLTEPGMPSVPSLMPIPRIQQALDKAGKPTAAWVGKALGRFLGESL